MPFPLTAPCASAGKEYSFGQGGGVGYDAPRQAAGAKYRETIDMGTTPKTQKEIDAILITMLKEYPGNSYHITNKCVPSQSGCQPILPRQS